MHTCVVSPLINRGYAFFFNRHSNEASSKMAGRNVRISTVKAEREKPLLLETPSLVSSQTTAHVINECFSKLLASRDLPWDNKSVSNLALSKTGDRLRHNNRLAEDLKEVSSMDLKETAIELGSYQYRLVTGMRRSWKPSAVWSSRSSEPEHRH